MQINNTNNYSSYDTKSLYNIQTKEQDEKQKVQAKSINKESSSQEIHSCPLSGQSALGIGNNLNTAC